MISADREFVNIGFIGLGSQGAPMARAIIAAGCPTTLWARRAETLEVFRDGPAVIAESPAALAAASDIVCLCVVSDSDVRELIDGPAGVLQGLQAGGTVVVHSTVHPDTCREIAQRASAQGISVLDAPVSGGAPAAENRQLLVMVGGDAAAVERCRPVFETYGNPVVHMGGLGSGQVAKLLNNLLFTANLGSAMSLLTLADSLGLSRADMCTVLGQGSAASMALQSLAAFDGLPANIARVAGALLHKDVRLAAELADRHAADTAVFDHADAALTLMGFPR
jgi:3-hydroxyisobutyrate dehydrogenase